MNWLDDLRFKCKLNLNFKKIERGRFFGGQKYDLIEEANIFEQL